ncbi:MAG: SAM-dependent methyltransferase [Micrococcales bacterium]|nr:SAM-dependent methyltransferase [Micrococcales bacterium]
MDVAELRALLSPEGLRLLDEVGPFERTDDVVATVARLRAAGHPPERVAAVLSQAKLRARALRKFGPFAARMLFTEAGLEQATRLRVASMHAGRVASAGLTTIADLGCGIGGDAMAFAGLGLRVLAVEGDEATAAIAAYNLAPFPGARVEHADLADVDLEDIDAVWLDPARRAGSRRFSEPSDWSPSLDDALALAADRPAGVKLAPALDRALIPPTAEAQWISVDRELVEVVLWSGALAREGVRRAALVLGDEGANELTATQEAEDAPPGPLSGWLYEPDPAVIRAHLIGDLARALGGRMLDRTIAWITADQPVDTAFAQRFRVVAQLPFDTRWLGRELRARGIGTLEIKKRGVDVDPARFRQRLALRGDGSATLVLTRMGARRVALLAERA